MAKVVVGLSGGVDSSVAALLLQQQGHEVIGVFMKNWHDTAVTISDECPWEEDSKDALLVAEKLGIPFQTLDLSEEYKTRIVDYMFNEYESGRTPNPDVLCNREIKFDVFLKAALTLGADFVATGHYCRKDVETSADGEVTYKLLSGVDRNKDQSYFLCQVNQYQLSKALFPIGHLEKKVVRELAQTAGLITAEKRDSQGLCFIGKVRLPEFLQQRLQSKRGTVIEIPASSEVYAANLNTEPDHLAHNRGYQTDMGIAVGQHEGAHFYTVGQRKGLRIGGKAEPLFVLETDVATNTIFVGMGEEHPGLFRKALFMEERDVHWVLPLKEPSIGASADYQCRIRYRQSLQQASLMRKNDGYYLLFEKAQKAIAPGQFAAWYDGDVLVGSGIIAP